MSRRVAVVTGAAGHIGRVLVARLEAAGTEVIGVDVPGAPAGTDTWWEVDLAAPDAETVLTARCAGLDRIDLLVHGAGITALGTLADTDAATFRRVLDVNLHGAIALTRAALPALRAAGGHVVVLSSVAGLLPVTGRPAYVAAKHAVTGAFRALAPELAADGVAVTVVHPTFLDTPVGASDTARSTTGAAITADDVVAAITRAVTRRRRTGRAPQRVLVGRTAHLADLAHRLAPATAVRLAARRLAEGR